MDDSFRTRISPTQTMSPLATTSVNSFFPPASGPLSSSSSSGPLTSSPPRYPPLPFAHRDMAAAAFPRISQYSNYSDQPQLYNQNSASTTHHSSTYNTQPASFGFPTQSDSSHILPPPSMSSSTPSAATAFAPAPTPPPPIFIGGSNGSGSLPSPHEATFQPPLSLPTDPIGSTAEAALVSKGYQLFPSMRQFQQQQQQGASPMLNNGLPGSSIPPFNMPPPPPLATRGFPGNGVAPPSTQSVINGGGGAGIGKGKAPGTGEFGGDDISEDSRNNATSEDSIQTTKANLSRHVTSVITHFTASKDGYRRLVNELDDFLHVVSPQGSILYCSPSAKRHLGISAEDLEGQQLADFIHPDDRQLLIGHINISVVDHAEYSAFCRFRRTSGEYVLFEIRGKPFPAVRSEGEVRFVVQAGREYRSKGSLSVDSILELRIENLRLRKRLEESLIARGVDPKAHPLLRAEITETAPSAHPYDLDVGGNLATHISEEDFLGQMVGPAEPMGAMARDDDAGHPPSVFGSVVGGGAGGGPLGAAAAANRRRSLDGTPDRKMGGNKRVADDDAGSAGKASRKRKNKVPLEELFCRQCGSTSSPEWRKGPLGPKTLCNACGLAYSKKLQKEKKRMQKLADAEGGGNGDKDGGSGKNIAGDESTNDD